MPIITPSKQTRLNMKSFTTKIPDEQNDLIKAEAERLGMSRQKYIEKRVIEDHAIKLAKKILNK